MTRLHVGWCALALLTSACGKSEPTPAPAPAPAPAATAVAAAPAPTATDPAVQRLYDQTCKTCHSVPGTGAPQVGDAAAWAPRAAQGMDTLLEHVINGFKGMPPLGSCSDCGEDDFRELIRYMAQLP